ncbi:MAG TPA: CoA transferase [Mycobacteriales bacterium]|nr:CoA transferase [Mycobacteriales bacterium]
MGQQDGARRAVTGPGAGDIAGTYAGVRVLDVTTTLAGATASMFLGDFGADVLRIQPHAPDPGDPAYLFGNRNKHVAVLDERRRGDRDELQRLLAAADVAVFDAAAATLAGQGLDASTLSAAAPGLVHVTMPGYGETGAWSQLPADPLLLAALAGVSDYHKATEERPVTPVVPVLAYAHGGLAATAAAAALFDRLETGVGRPVVVTGLHAVAAMQSVVMVDAVGVRRLFSGAKGQADSSPNYTTYRCADGEWLYLGALVEPFFLRALDVLDAMEIMVLPEVDGSFANVLAPGTARTVNARLQQAFARRPRAEWIALFDRAEVPVSPVLDRDEWFGSETISANGMRVSVGQAGLGAVTLPGVPVRLSATPGRVRSLPGPEQTPERFWTVAGPRIVEPGTGARTKPLAGLRVVDGATFLAAPFASTLLLEYGASVVKVESPEGDPYRFFPASFAVANRGKRSVVADLKDEAGRATLLELLRTADVYVDNLRPSARSRLGLDESALLTANPRLIHASFSAYGEGPLRDHPGFDPLLQARSGMLRAQGGDDAPSMSTMPVNDIGAGIALAFGILAAAYHRRSTGQTQQVSSALANVSVWLQGVELTRYPGSPPPQAGCRDFPGPTAFHRLYGCVDGWIALAATDEDSAAAVLQAFGVPRTDPAAALATVGHDGPQAMLLADALRDLPRDQVIQQLSERAIPVVPVLARTDVFTDPWLQENGFYRDVQEPELGTCTIVDQFARWPGVAEAPADRVAALGEDNGRDPWRDGR